MAHVPGAPKKAWWAISTVLASVVVVAALIAVRIQPDEGKAQPAHGDVQGRTAREPLPLLEPSEALHSLAAPEGGEWRVVSQLPRIYVHDDFLSDSECETLKQQVAGRLEPAKVVQKADNKFDEQVSVRNNKQIWLNYTQEKDLPEVFHLLKRMHRAARIPDDDAEALQIGLYGPGEKYETHQDSDPQKLGEQEGEVLGDIWVT
ncbi:P4H6 [Symbiodinium natans]|uniref:P4H6 protein n=1 Tax=Symbiodinium natans TaxID=878477 RepID=A0A812Q2H3_9DINO|nr:P4H6 [Symbiodinium natans]